MPQKIHAPAVKSKRVLCAKCDAPYTLHFTATNRGINPGCPKCRWEAWSYSTRSEVAMLCDKWGGLPCFCVDRIEWQFPGDVILAVGGRSELVAEGRLALLLAAQKWDPAYRSEKTGGPVQFKSYAITTIKSRLRVFITTALRTGANGEPIMATDGTGWVIGSKSLLSLDIIMEGDPSGGDSPMSVEDRNASDPIANAAESERTNRLHRYLGYLSPRIRSIIEMRYFANFTLEEAARVIKVSKERVRQLEVDGLRRLCLFYGTSGTPKLQASIEKRRGRLERFEKKRRKQEPRKKAKKAG